MQHSKAAHCDIETGVRKIERLGITDMELEMRK
jgi:hypothetical protein